MHTSLFIGSDESWWLNFTSVCILRSTANFGILVWLPLSFYFQSSNILMPRLGVQINTAFSSCMNPHEPW